MSINALSKAITTVGGQGKLAGLIGKRQGHIGNWLHRDKKVPAEVCVAIETATGGEVTRYDLRPDVFGPPPKRTRRAA
jgi:DNA-binding transcriptional regulator YdaS (Cro superfamily)|tara:strand:+ start:1175 stop:1408 length:234 start_codon:yes stop_codon:yes gene_type:complete